MNIFVLHPNPNKAARWHADKHVVKMILEAVQMLYTAHWIVAFPFLLKHRAAMKISQVQKTLPLPPSLRSAPLAANGQRGYRPVHLHHPCTVWVRESLANYQWLCKLAIALGRENQHRWPQSKPHSCEEHARWLLANPPSIPNLPLVSRNLKVPADKQPSAKALGCTPFAVAMPDEYKRGDPIKSYRAFYSGSKTDRGITKNYTNRHKPHWLSGKSHLSD